MEAEDPAVVDDAVDDRGGHVPVAEHVAPSAGLEVRGGDVYFVKSVFRV